MTTPLDKMVTAIQKQNEEPAERLRAYMLDSQWYHGIEMLDEALAAERRATVERIRAAMQKPDSLLTSFNAYTPDEPQGFIKAYVAAALDRILDEEAAGAEGTAR